MPLDSPPRPDGVTTWEEYVAALRTLRLWAGARGDAELAANAPGLTVAEVRRVLGETRRAVPDRRAAELIVRACLLLREWPEEEIGAEQRVWRAAWDGVLAAVHRPRGGRGRAVAAGVLLPAVTGVAVNLATSNTGDPWAWGAVGLVLVAHASLLAAGPARWVREPVLVGTASAVAVAVTVALVLAFDAAAPPPASRAALPSGSPPPAPEACRETPVRPAIIRPDDPDLRRTWRFGYSCPNDPAPVHLGPDATTRTTGLLKTTVSLFLCRTGKAGRYWYRTVADVAYEGRGWGYVSEAYVHAPHPVPGLAPCPG
ncbi:hypothetical protein MF672_040990 [Actinomadura sp. ATCC 31491]|uniref:SH3 domain-containing protein n=1 Tax=Actinomadura luzonensis TaxID=2805427 RepID=A0ABT0G689_9ACTN|nr:hypothetical protein [Actinomadura luzonensis]